MTDRKHLTLRQHPDPNKQGAYAYIVAETRNTISWHVGQVLYPADMQYLNDLPWVSYTVKGEDK